MPRSLQLVSGYYTAGAAGTGTATPSPGDTFNVPSFNISSQAYLAQVIASGASTDFVRIRSPRLHDANQGIRLYIGTTTHRNLLPWDNGEVLYPSDTPTVEIDETAAATGAISILYEFADLAGASPRLASWSEVRPRIQHISGVEVDVTSGAIGAFGTGAAINSSFDNFEAGADYAWLGWTTNAACHAIRLTGKDTGNLAIGGPGNVDPIETRNYWLTASQATGRPFIPIIAANNKGSTLLQNMDTAATTAVKVTLILAQLS